MLTGTKGFIGVLSSAFVVALAATAGANHESIAQLRLEYERQRQELVRTHHQQLDFHRHGYQQTLDELRLQSMQAVQLCGPEREVALQAVAAQRREAAERYRCQLRELNARHQQAMQQLNEWFHHSLRALQQVSVVPTLPHSTIYQVTPYSTFRPDTCPASNAFPGTSDVSISLGNAGVSFGIPTGGYPANWSGYGRHRSVYRSMERHRGR
jgi:hypothetical protein